MKHDNEQGMSLLQESNQNKECDRAVAARRQAAQQQRALVTPSVPQVGQVYFCVYTPCMYAPGMYVCALCVPSMYVCMNECRSACVCMSAGIYTLYVCMYVCALYVCAHALN